MEKTGIEEASGTPPLPPSPSIPPNVKPEQVALLSVLLLVGGVLVSITSEDKRVVDGKGIGRKVIDRLYLTYSSELAGKKFAYDGEKSLYTVGPLPQNNFEFTVVVEELLARRHVLCPIANGSPGANGSPSGNGKRPKCSFRSKTFKDALRVLDIILRQQAANRGCLLVRQSFFHDDSRHFTDVGGGVTGCRGFHSSFRTTQGGLSLNMDVSTTMILTPGPVIDFLLANQNIRDPRHINWEKATNF
ncbi:Protein argonaute 16 [Vitis vinifera]|uniref:Protein argonaute 16 n=1 Tax=Vitis vinifera TaxID=29760 RepID=A0A438IL23_VITVI|nr:Protein argonaute 16 [Vitis vinifera]